LTWLVPPRTSTSSKSKKSKKSKKRHSTIPPGTSTSTSTSSKSTSTSTGTSTSSKMSTPKPSHGRKPKKRPQFSLGSASTSTAKVMRRKTSTSTRSAGGPSIHKTACLWADARSNVQTTLYTRLDDLVKKEKKASDLDKIDPMASILKVFGFFTGSNKKPQRSTSNLPLFRFAQKIVFNNEGLPRNTNLIFPRDLDSCAQVTFVFNALTRMAHKWRQIRVKAAVGYDAKDTKENAERTLSDRARNKMRAAKRKGKDADVLYCIVLYRIVLYRILISLLPYNR